MKKALILFSVAALALVSCAKVTDQYVGAPESHEIAFQAVAAPATKAAGAAEYNAVENTAYPQNYDMKVVAYSVPVTGTAGNYFGANTADGGILFGYNYAAGASGASHGYWGGKTAAQYWPLSPATINFLAVSHGGSPTADVVTETFNANYASGVSVALADNQPATAATGNGQHDLMYAFGRANVTQSGNTLTFPDKVDMTFEHALAWVYFRVKAASSVEQAITINSITLNNADYSGTFSAAVTNYDKAKGAGDLAWGTCQWTTSGSTASVASPNYSASSLTTTFVGVGDGLLIIPKGSLATPAAAFDSFTVEYEYNDNTYEYTYEPTAAERTLLMGKKYIFDITFQLHEIFVNASVANWDVNDFDAGTEGTQNKDITIQ